MKKSPWHISAAEFWERYRFALDDSAPPARTPANNGVRWVDKGMPRPSHSGNGQFDSASARRRDNDRSRDLDPGYLEGLYERATGEPPHEVLVLESGVLIETGVVGSSDYCPNGYLPLLLSRTASGWILFDTGHSAPKAQLIPGDVDRDGDILYVKIETLDELQGGIARMVRVLRELKKG